MKTKHFYSFNIDIMQNMKSNKLDVNNWEFLRANDPEGDFSIEKTRSDYIKSCESSKDYQKVAQEICNIASKYDWNKIISMGIGKGILEYHIQKIMPKANITCTDYTQNSLNLLKEVFTECNDFQVFDMINDNWTDLKKSDVIIIFRLSTEFSKKQWNIIFEKMHAAGINNIIYIPTELLDFKLLINEKINYFFNLLQKRKNIFCGWMYSEKEFKKFFHGSSQKALYLIESIYKVDSYTIFELKRNM